VAYLITLGPRCDEAEAMLGPALHQLLETIAMLAAMVHLPTGQCAVVLGLVIAVSTFTAIALAHLHRRLPRAQS
jgi:hypothetical protein